MLAGLLELSAGIGMTALYSFRHFTLPKPMPNPIRRKDWRWILRSVFAGSLLAPVLQTYGIKYSTAASASLLLTLEGVFTAIISWLVFREAFDRSIAIGLLMITLGSTVLIWSGDATHLSWGSLAVVISALAWASTANFMRQLSNLDPIQVTSVRSCLSGGLNVLLALAIGNALPSWSLLAPIALTGFICIGITYLCYMLALRNLNTATVGTFFAIFPFTGAILSVLFLGEPVTQQLLVSGGLMAIGLWICLKYRRS
jgi:drug/metabolite transporter (DMT)-like permease